MCFKLNGNYSFPIANYSLESIPHLPLRLVIRQTTENGIYQIFTFISLTDDYHKDKTCNFSSIRLWMVTFNVKIGTNGYQLLIPNSSFLIPHLSGDYNNAITIRFGHANQVLRHRT